MFELDFLEFLDPKLIYDLANWDTPDEGLLPKVTFPGLAWVFSESTIPPELYSISYRNIRFTCHLALHSNGMSTSQAPHDEASSPKLSHFQSNQIKTCCFIVASVNLSTKKTEWLYVAWTRRGWKNVADDNNTPSKCSYDGVSFGRRKSENRSEEKCIACGARTHKINSILVFAFFLLVICFLLSERSTCLFLSRVAARGNHCNDIRRMYLFSHTLDLFLWQSCDFVSNTMSSAFFPAASVFCLAFLWVEVYSWTKALAASPNDIRRPIREREGSFFTPLRLPEAHLRLPTERFTGEMKFHVSASGVKVFLSEIKYGGKGLAVEKKLYF